MSEQWVEPADPSRPARERLRHLIRRTPGAQEAAQSLRQISPQRAFERVRETAIFAVQCAIAAGIALLVAEQFFTTKQHSSRPSLPSSAWGFRKASAYAVDLNWFWEPQSALASAILSSP